MVVIVFPNFPLNRVVFGGAKGSANQIRITAPDQEGLTDRHTIDIRTERERERERSDIGIQVYIHQIVWMPASDAHLNGKLDRFGFVQRCPLPIFTCHAEALTPSAAQLCQSQYAMPCF